MQYNSSKFLSFKTNILATGLIIFSTIFFSACFDEYSTENQRKRCEATPCTDTLCLIWNPIINRCGTKTALQEEVDRQAHNDIYYHLDNIDSLQKMQIKIIEKHIQYIDSLDTLLKKKMDGYKIKESHIDSIVKKINQINFCKSLQNHTHSCYWLYTL